MADPISLIGLGAGAASLMFQVFAGCIQGYRLLSDAAGMPEECQYLRVRLDMEHYRLLDWSQVAGIGGGPADPGTGAHHMRGTIQLHRHLILDVLSAIRTVLSDVGKVNGRYEELRPVQEDELGGSREAGKGMGAVKGSLEKMQESVSRPDPGLLETGGGGGGGKKAVPGRSRGITSTMKRALAAVDQASAMPRKLRWATFDKGKFEGLLKRLTELNDFLQSVMDESQARALQITQHHTHMEVLQLSSDVKELQHLIRALSYSEGSAVSQADAVSGSRRFLLPTMVNRTEEKRTLARLARFKAFNASTENSSELESTQISSKKLILKDKHLKSRSEAVFQASRNLAPTQVWIEWKLHDDLRPVDDGPNPVILNRVQQLAALLGQRFKPKEFRTPNCLGYVFDDGEMNEDGSLRFGFVFDKPEDSLTAKPLSLFEVISEGASSGRSVPSLTDRVGLASKVASCLLYLHSVDWLHKGLRSHNIIFFADDNHPDLKHPYISGFDYARPAGPEEMTEKPPENAEYDIYRHPRIHGDSGPRESFKKSFDIYSLGVILLEIAYWKPIHRVLGIEDLSQVKPKVTAGIQRRLLSESEYLDGVAASMGNIYREVARACLLGAESFGVSDNADESRSVVGAQLQAAFSELVVEKLEALKV